MHYQAAERSLLLLNNELVQKIVKTNMQKAYPLVVNGLINANIGPNAHWNPQVNSITKQVLITYMELNRDMFDKIKS